MITLYNKTVNIEYIKELASHSFGDMIKGVVDVRLGIIALDAELHADLESLLISQGSQQDDLWGINLYPEMEGDDFLEFDAMINIRPRQGNRSRGVEDPAVREKISNLVFSIIIR